MSQGTYTVNPTLCGPALSEGRRSVCVFWRVPDRHIGATRSALGPRALWEARSVPIGSLVGVMCRRSRGNPEPSIGAARSCAAGAASDTCQSRPVVANYRWT